MTSAQIMTGGCYTGKPLLQRYRVTQVRRDRGITNGTGCYLKRTDLPYIFTYGDVDYTPRDVVRHRSEDHGERGVWSRHACDAATHFFPSTLIPVRFRKRYKPSLGR